MALACSFLAINSNDRYLEHQGIEIYNSALNAMVRGLQHKSGVNIHMLYASILLHTRETLYASDDALQSLFTHVKGGSALLKQQNLADLDGFASSILKRHKWTIMTRIEALSNSMPAYCILNTNYGSEEDWDCLRIGRTASPLDEIFAMIADCASLQRDLMASLRILGSERDLALHTLLRRCYELEQLQGDWCYRNSQGFSPSTDNQRQGDSHLSLGELTVIPHDFGSLDIAKTYCLFWISSIVVKRVMYQIQKQLKGTCDPTPVVCSAREICQTVAFCMKPNTQMSVGHMVLFAISQASKGYIDCGDIEMFNWCHCVSIFTQFFILGELALLGARVRKIGYCGTRSKNERGFNRIQWNLRKMRKQERSSMMNWKTV
ncbi:hypothetical protein N7456_007413 [Penicillium angulare]|uniref:Uncharacterized protein n=1 Tax=Penicillium angulare TaxID=116970 RepID=A0A9W9K975_9EURO|nr:hypothetical protein N7456_007413 [Penicillium angulare]